MSNNKKYDFVCRTPKMEINSVTNQQLLDKIKKKYYNELLKELNYIEKVAKTDQIVRSYYVSLVANIYEFYDSIGIKETLSSLEEEYKRYKNNYNGVIKNYVMTVYLITEEEELKKINCKQNPSLEYIQQQIISKINNSLNKALGFDNLDNEDIILIINICKKKYVNWCLSGFIDINTAKDKCHKEVKKEIRKYNTKTKISKLLSRKKRQN